MHKATTLRQPLQQYIPNLRRTAMPVHKKTTYKSQIKKYEKNKEVPLDIYCY